MGFRDDRDASVLRIEVLERDLAAAKNELEAATLRAAEVEDLRKRVVALTTERDALKIGVEPTWAARNQRLVVAGVFVAGVLAIGGVGVAYAVRRESVQQARLQARAEADLAQCEYQGEPLRQQRDSAREELRQIDAVHADELANLQRQLNVARLHEAGRSLLVTARVQSRQGSVPDGAADTCVMAIRDIGGGLCAAAVLCGDAQVFPFDEPPPDVVCTGTGGAAWRADGDVALETVSARVDSRSPELLAYDAHAHTLEVRETGAGSFALHLRVTDVLPFRLR